MTAIRFSDPSAAESPAPGHAARAGVLPFPCAATPGEAAAGPAGFAGGAARLTRLRHWARRARLAPAFDTARACALIGPPDAAEADAFGVTLLRALEAAEGRAPVTRPAACRAAAPSRDEAWLLRLLEAAEAGDRDSARFLVWRRLDHASRREILFLALRAADSLRAEAAAETQAA